MVVVVDLAPSSAAILNTRKLINTFKYLMTSCNNRLNIKYFVSLILLSSDQYIIILSIKWTAAHLTFSLAQFLG